MGDKNPVQAAKTTFDILNEIVERGEASVNDISESLGIAQSTTHNYLKTLAQNGYLINEDSRYRIGLRFLVYGEQARNQWQVYETAKPELKNLAVETGDFANLLVEENGYGFYIYRTKGDRTATSHQYIGGYVGERVPLHASAPGKAILAHLEPERIEGILDQCGMEQLTDETIQERGVLYDELESIRNSGVAYDDEEYIDGLRAVAAPIVSHGKVNGAISISGPISKFDEDRFENELPNIVADAANTIEIDLEFS